MFLFAFNACARGKIAAENARYCYSAHGVQLPLQTFQYNSQYRNSGSVREISEHNRKVRPTLNARDHTPSTFCTGNAVACVWFWFRVRDRVTRVGEHY
eukprot:2217942-Rhodomonas_salina.1